MDSSELVPRVLAIYWPLLLGLSLFSHHRVVECNITMEIHGVMLTAGLRKLKILNWQGDEVPMSLN